MPIRTTTRPSALRSRRFAIVRSLPLDMPIEQVLAAARQQRVKLSAYQVREIRTRLRLTGQDTMFFPRLQLSRLTPAQAEFLHIALRIGIDEARILIGKLAS